MSYDWNNTYQDHMGIPEISRLRNEGWTPNSRLVVTPYGAYPLMLIDRGLGLQWHHYMLSRSKMQTIYGSHESSKAFNSDDLPARMTSDTKVTCNLAALFSGYDMIGNDRLDIF